MMVRRVDIISCHALEWSTALSRAVPLTRRADHQLDNMGGGVSVPVPLSSSQMTILQQKYALYSERGSDDEELGNMLEAKLPGIIVCVARATRAAPPPLPSPHSVPLRLIRPRAAAGRASVASGSGGGGLTVFLLALLPTLRFDQIDCDHTGSVSKKELKRMMKALPRNKPVPPPGGWPDGQAPKVIGRSTRQSLTSKRSEPVGRSRLRPSRPFGAPAATTTRCVGRAFEPPTMLLERANAHDRARPPPAPRRAASARRPHHRTTTTAVTTASVGYL